jgi:hypothetical protein
VLDVLEQASAAVYCEVQYGVVQQTLVDSAYAVEHWCTANKSSEYRITEAPTTESSTALRHCCTRHHTSHSTTALHLLFGQILQHTLDHFTQKPAQGSKETTNMRFLDMSDDVELRTCG